METLKNKIEPIFNQVKESLKKYAEMDLNPLFVKVEDQRSAIIFGALFSHQNGGLWHPDDDASDILGFEGMDTNRLDAQMNDFCSVDWKLGFDQYEVCMCIDSYLHDTFDEIDPEVYERVIRFFILMNECELLND